MKTIVRLVVVTAFLAAWAQAAMAQTADEIIEKHLAAMGGRAALQKIKSRLVTGTLALTTPVGNMAGTVELLNEAPNKSRNLMKVDLSAAGIGLVTIDQRFNGETAYAMDSLQGNREITGNALDNMKASSFPTPFLNYKERGATVELGGKEKVGDRDAYVLTYKPKTGSAVRMYLDAQTYLPLRSVVKVNVPQLGQDVEQTTDFSDYRDVDGVKIPFQIKNSSPLQTYSITATKVEQNIQVDESLFSKPAEGK
jgi:outer membrane lipoprotein-sorting protein